MDERLGSSERLRSRERLGSRERLMGERLEQAGEQYQDIHQRQELKVAEGVDGGERAGERNPDLEAGSG